MYKAVKIKKVEPLTKHDHLIVGHSKHMTMKELAEKAKRELVNLTGFSDPNAVGAKKENNEWLLTIEVVEKKSIPEGMDILGNYEVRMDQNGNILNYERTDLRKRIDTALVKEE